MTKRTFTALAAATVLAAVLTGCSGSVYYEDPMDPMYRGNVSTTEDGRVNGTNRDLEQGLYPYEGTMPNRSTDVTRGTSRGTGMTGGR